MVEVITCTNSITAIGHDGVTCAASYGAGVSRIGFSDTIEDSNGRPVKTAEIEGLDIKEPRDSMSFMVRVSEMCLQTLCDAYFNKKHSKDPIFLFMGFPSKQRPGQDLQRGSDVENKLERILKTWGADVFIETFPTGNASMINALLRSRETLSTNPFAVCIVGAADSLLFPETLSWFEQDRRLKSESNESDTCLVPSQAVSFLIVESKQAAFSRKSPILAHVKGVSKTMEPGPYVSETPCKGVGLTQAVKLALSQDKTAPTAIDAVYGDLNGEYHRSKEWGLCDLRCFEQGNPDKALHHPADCLGSIGAASMPVFVNLAVESFKKQTGQKKALLFASDDFGERGAMILEKPELT